jgi:hypothetical protein
VRCWVHSNSPSPQCRRLWARFVGNSGHWERKWRPSIRKKDDAVKMLESNPTVVVCTVLIVCSFILLRIVVRFVLILLGYLLYRMTRFSTDTSSHGLKKGHRKWSMIYAFTWRKQQYWPPWKEARGEG